MAGDLRYWTQDMDTYNDIDLMSSVIFKKVVAIVDEQAGGIIAYALGQDHADSIVAALRKGQ